MPAGRFQTTNWSLVFAAGGSPDALNDLCARYWSPVYAYVRRCGHDPADAEDLTQAFFSRMLEHRDLARSEERRVGKECRSRRSPYEHEKKAGKLITRE